MVTTNCHTNTIGATDHNTADENDACDASPLSVASDNGSSTRATLEDDSARQSIRRQQAFNDTATTTTTTDGVSVDDRSADKELEQGNHDNGDAKLENSNEIAPFLAQEATINNRKTAPMTLQGDEQGNFANIEESESSLTSPVVVEHSNQILALVDGGSVMAVKENSGKLSTVLDDFDEGQAQKLGFDGERKLIRMQSLPGASTSDIAPAGNEKQSPIAKSGATTEIVSLPTLGIESAHNAKALMGTDVNTLSIQSSGLRELTPGAIRVQGPDAPPGGGGIDESFNNGSRHQLSDPLQPPPLVFSQAGVVTLKAKLIENEKDLEDQMRERIYKEAVEGTAEKAGWSRGRIVLTVVLAVTVIGAIVVGAIVVTGGDDSGNGGPTGMPSAFPSPSPTLSPSLSSYADELLAMLVEISPDNGEALQDLSSPQYQAFEWVINDTKEGVQTRQRIIQRYALATLYYSTGGDEWVKRTGWLSANDECRWWNGRGGADFCTKQKVAVSFEMSDNNMQGQIPRELSLLRNSRVIDFSGNNLTGSLFTELGLLIDLERLFLDGNLLTGVIPSELGTSMESLLQLKLATNRFKGPLPTNMGLMPKLEILDLSSNPINSTLPTELSMMSRLEKLNIAESGIRGVIPSEFGLLTNLEFVWLGFNGIRGSLPKELGNITDLEILDIQRNMMTGSIPLTIGRLTRLEELLCSSNDLQGSLPVEIKNLRDLKTFICTDNMFTGTLHTQIGTLQKLRNLQIGKNVLTGTIPSEVALLTSLSILMLDFNSLTGTIPTETGLLRDMEQFFFDCNQLSGTLPSELGNLARCNSLVGVANDALVGSIPSEIGSMARLSLLAIGGSMPSLTTMGTLPSELGNLSRLRTLRIVNAAVSGAMPTELGKLTSLGSLELTRCQFSGTIPSELGQLTQLSSLLLTENNLTGTIPAELNGLFQLGDASFVMNSLTGSMPLCEVGRLAADCPDEIACEEECCDTCCTDGIPCALPSAFLPPGGP